MTSSSASSLDNPSRRLTVGGGMRHACHVDHAAVRAGVAIGAEGLRAPPSPRAGAARDRSARFLAKTYDRGKDATTRCSSASVKLPTGCR